MLNRGLYVITDTGLGNRLLPAVEQALRGGAVVVQYRDKSDDRERRLGEARALATLCRFYHVPLLINDDVVTAPCAQPANVWAPTPFSGPPATTR